MSAAQHTPGPWTWERNYEGLSGQPNENGAGLVLEFFDYEGLWLSAYHGEAVRDANARLIAAAPELLEALQACVPILFPSSDEYAMASAAIAKATGSTT